MEDKDKKAVNELKEFFKKKDENKNLLETVDDGFIDAVGVFNSLGKLFEKFSGNIDKEKTRYVEVLVQEVIKAIPKEEIPTLDEIFKYVDSRIEKPKIPELPSLETIVENVLELIPLNEQKQLSVVDVIDTIKQDKTFLAMIKGEKGDPGIKGKPGAKGDVGYAYGPGGGGLGTRQVHREIQERARLAVFDNSGTSFLSTNINDAIIEAAAGVPPSSAFDVIKLNPSYTSATTPIYDEGVGFYDYLSKTWAIYGDQPDVTLKCGQQTQVIVYNATGYTISNGTAVQILSAVGGRPMIQEALATIPLADRFVGVTIHDIAPTSTGLVMINGLVENVNTSTYNIGDVLYLSTTTSGSFQTTKPISPYPIVKVGYVIESDPIIGKILVEIDEKPIINPFSKLLHVSTSGIDSTDVDGTEIRPYRTIKYAISSITDNSITNRYTIRVGPGIFSEVNPIQMKEYVSIDGIGGKTTTRIDATVSNQALILGNDRTEISSLTLKNVSGYCIEMFSASERFVIQDIQYEDSKGWVYVNHPDANVYFQNALMDSDQIIPTLTEVGIKVDAGSLNFNNLHIIDSVSAITIMECSGSDSNITGINFDSDTSQANIALNCVNNANINLKVFDIRNVGTAIYVDTSGYTNLSNGYIKDCDLGLCLDGNTTKTEINGIVCDECTWDLSATSGTIIRGGGNSFRDDKMSIDNADVIFTHISETPGDEGFSIKGDLHVGSPEQPKESIFGQGDSYVYGMLVYQGDETSAITNITSAAQSITGSTFSFASNSAEQCIYMASDLLRSGNYFGHLGVKLSIDTSANGGDVAFEYWNGIAWTSFNYMITDSDSPYYPYAKNLEIPVGSYQVRYDNFELKNIRWTKNDPLGDGNNRYWIRWRITTPFTQMPIFEQIKLHSSRTEMNSDGWMEFFGRARPIGTLPWSFGLLGKNVGMGNGDVFLGDNIFSNYESNVWDSNGDNTGFQVSIPLDCDTSTPIKLSWVVRPAVTGTASWEVRYAYSNTGDDIYISTVAAPTSAATEQVLYTSGATVEGQQIWFSVNLDVSDLLPRISSGYTTILWVNIIRTESSGNLRGFVLSPEYTKWSLGGHIDPDID